MAVWGPAIFWWGRDSLDGSTRSSLATCAAPGCSDSGEG